MDIIPKCWLSSMHDHLENLLKILLPLGKRQCAHIILRYSVPILKIMSFLCNHNVQQPIIRTSIQHGSCNLVAMS
uniref:Uncharacterized protein n=1 Tax=Arundo donax TaxID=35708 RepID=A0A0A9F6E4_ARUDO